MKTQKNFAELFGIIAKSVSIIGLVIFILPSAINLFFFKGTVQILDSIGVIGALVFMTPVFMLQFTVPAGLFNKKNIPSWVKILLYLILFPFADLWILSAADVLFHFLPNYHIVAAQSEVLALREQCMSQLWTMINIIYLSMIGAGLLFKKIFGNKFGVKIS